MTIDNHEPLEQRAKFSYRAHPMPDGRGVQSITAWNEGMTSNELGQMVAALDEEFHPLKIIIINK